MKILFVRKLERIHLTMVNTEYPCYNISVFEDYLNKYLIDCCGKVIVSAMTFSLYMEVGDTA